MRVVRLLCMALVGAAPHLGSGVAEDGCGKFAWALARERAWFAVSDKLSLAAGETVSAIPQGAFVLKLQSGGEASFVLPPERKVQPERWFGGIVQLPAPDGAGIYGITASHEAWIDVVQD